MITAQSFGIGVLFGVSFVGWTYVISYSQILDLHAAPGKQNKDSHSGTSSPVISFFNNKFNMQLAIRVLCVLVTNLIALRAHETAVNNIVGVQLLNEPHPSSHEKLYDWYRDAIREIRDIDSGFPIYISDCWMTDQYADFVAHLPSSLALTCVDHHLYRCFTECDISTSAAQHTASLADRNAPFPQMFSRASEKLAASGSGLIVGEWSGALNPGSLQGTADEHQKRASYIRAQLDLFELYCAGSFFWTYKKELPGDQGWSFRDAVENGIFPEVMGMIPVKDYVGLSADTNTRKVTARNVASGEFSDPTVTISSLIFFKANMYPTGLVFLVITSIGALKPASIRAGSRLMTSSPSIARVRPPSQNWDSRAALQRGRRKTTFVKTGAATTFGSSVSALFKVVSPSRFGRFSAGSTTYPLF